jgi:hypothetical protein
VIIKGRGEGWEDVDAGKMAFRVVAKKTMRFDRSNKAWGEDVEIGTDSRG